MPPNALAPVARKALVRLAGTINARVLSGNGSPRSQHTRPSLAPHGAGVTDAAKLISSQAVGNM